MPFHKQLVKHVFRHAFQGTTTRNTSPTSQSRPRGSESRAITADDRAQMIRTRSSATFLLCVVLCCSLSLWPVTQPPASSAARRDWSPLLCSACVSQSLLRPRARRPPPSLSGYCMLHMHAFYCTSQAPGAPSLSPPDFPDHTGSSCHHGALRVHTFTQCCDCFNASPDLS